MIIKFSQKEKCFTVSCVCTVRSQVLTTALGSNFRFRLVAYGEPVTVFKTNMFRSSSSVSFNPSTDIPDLSGKVIIVTGGTYNTN